MECVFKKFIVWIEIFYLRFLYIGYSLLVIFGLNIVKLGKYIVLWIWGKFKFVFLFFKFVFVMLKKIN